MLDKEYKYYLKNQVKLLKKYKGRFLVIKDENVVGVYGTNEEAYNEATKQYKLGSFLIQECLEKDAGVTQTFNSRAVFS